MMKSALSLMFVGCLTTSIVAANPDWSAVRNLAPDTKIVLKAKSRKRSERYVVSVDDSVLRVKRASSEQVVESISRADVIEIRTAPAGGWVHRHPGLTGALIGFAAGAGLGYVAFSCHDCAEFGNFGGVVGAAYIGAVGAGLGALEGRNQGGHVVYRAP